jgi:cell wall assembly regulator SMI1
MKTLWSRFHDELARQYPEVLPSFNPAATQAQIEELERITGQTLPQDLRESYLIHNGCFSPPHEEAFGITGKPFNIDDVYPSILGSYRWCSLGDVLRMWQRDRELDTCYDESSYPYDYTEEEDPDSWENNAMRPWQHTPPQWLPIGLQHHDNSIYVDMLPGKKGTIGQLIKNFIASPKHLFTVSFKAQLEAITVALEHKALLYNSEHKHWFTKERGTVDALSMPNGWDRP